MPPAKAPTMPETGIAAGLPNWRAARPQTLSPRLTRTGVSHPSSAVKNGTLENTLKEMILREELAPGERLTETALAATLGVSRTPIRSALPRLAAEGYLRPVGKRGYIVAHFGEQETYDALQMRAMLEGWAARTLADRGAPADTLHQLDECLRIGDALFEKRHLDRDDETKYGEMNKRFHQAIVDGCDSPILNMFIDRLNRIPFVAPSAIVFDQIGLRAAFDMLHRAHGFHHAIVEAIKNGDGARAEMLFREHANHQRTSMFERRRTAKAPSNNKPTNGNGRSNARE
jgi:GntR family transcriptional regulator, vanillate catabolism transcriptional regulator